MNALKDYRDIISYYSCSPPFKTGEYNICESPLQISNYKFCVYDTCIGSLCTVCL